MQGHLVPEITSPLIPCDCKSCVTCFQALSLQSRAASSVSPMVLEL